MIKARTAKFQIGQIVRHRVFSFRGVIFDIDPEFNNTEEWWLSIPEEVRPHKDQPFYHLLAENSEFRIRRLCLRAEFAARRFRRADPAFAGRRDFREGQIGRLSPAQSVAELTLCQSRRSTLRLNEKGARSGAFLFVSRRVCYFAAGLAARRRLRLASSFLRCSSARFCSSSCSFFWFSSNTFGSVGGPS